MCLKLKEDTNITVEDQRSCHQWRREGGRGGGQLPPGAARRGAPKSCQEFLKNLYRDNFF